MFAFTSGCQKVRGRARIFFLWSSWGRRVATLAGILIFAVVLRGADAPAAAPASGTAAHEGAPKPSDADNATTKVHRSDFDMEYPVSWQEDTSASDYDPNANFMLFSPKSSSLQFIITPRDQDPKKVVDDAIKKIDGVQITTLSRSSLSEWGGHKGVGLYLKGKIVDSFPGGIKVFCFTSPKHNVLVIETSFSDDLKETQTDIDYIGHNFKMSN